MAFLTNCALRLPHLSRQMSVSRWVLTIKSEQQKEAYRNLALGQLSHLTKTREWNKQS